MTHPEWLENEVGANALTALRELLRELYPGFNGVPNFRYAPSIVCRSECEMFATGYPRFAVRASSNFGYVNLRRLPRLSKTLSGWSEPLTSEKLTSTNASGKTPDGLYHNVTVAAGLSFEETIKRQQRFFADSFLAVSDELAARCHIITARLLATASGEVGVGEMDIPGVPYVQHIEISGGLCAQSVCFMVASLLVQQCDKIEGIVEISLSRYLRRLEKHEQEVSCDPGKHSDQRTSLGELDLDFPLSGMTPDEICSYLNGIGFSAIRECLFNAEHFRKTEGVPLKYLEIAIVQTALRSYIMSGIPVVILVDVNKLGGFYRRTLGGRLNSKVAPERSGHAMLLVGVTRDRAHASFVCNDPRSLPFQEICDAEIVNASIKGRFECIPVLPRAVTIRLLDSVSAGLLTSIAYHIKQMARSESTDTIATSEFRSALARIRNRTNVCTNLGEFRLIHRQADGKLACYGCNSESELTRLLSKLDSDPQLGQLLSSGYFWLEVLTPLTNYGMEQECVIWKAERDPTQYSSIRDALPSVFVGCWNGYLEEESTMPIALRSNRSCVMFPPGPRAMSTAGANNARRISPSVITSFSCDGLSKSMEILSNLGWGENQKMCDAYIFMHQDDFVDPKMNTRTFMSEMATNESEIRNIADRMTIISDCKDVIIRAFASFIPEVSSVNEQLRKEAVNALVFLGRLAAAINRNVEPVESRISVIEIVAGSKTTGIWPAMQTRNSSLRTLFAASMLSRDRAIDQLLKSLCEVDEQLGAIDHCPRFAIELEPGPLYTIAYAEDLEELVHNLKRSNLSYRFGLNLDIAHWKLAGISITEARKLSNDVKSSILHAHLSGHFPLGHFGDVQPLLFDEADDFKHWLIFLSELPSGSYSGIVALEQEAVKSQPYLVNSFRQFLSFFDRPS